jgi:CRP-like cAMP-binding protein
MFVHIGVEQIAVLALFRGLTSVELAWVGERLHSRIFQTGTNVITIDQPGEVVYAILNGTVKVHIEQADGTDVILAILGPGDTLGEMSLLDTAGRSANAETLEESTLIWMDGLPASCWHLLRNMVKRIRMDRQRSRFGLPRGI